MNLSEALERLFDVARLGPEPLEQLIPKVEMIYGKAEPVPLTLVLQAVAQEGEGGAVRAVLSRQFARWDDEVEAAWIARTERGSVARRDRIYELMAVPGDGRALLSDGVPLHQRARPIVIKADRWDPWYGPERKVGRTFYWDGFCRHLRYAGGWGEESILGLDESTDAVVSRLADPLGATAYQSKGLVVGYVQSGKTANITGVVAKAVDAGYRLVVVLAGTLNLLRDQTQRRIDKELVGAEQLEDEYDDDADFEAFLRHGARPAQLGAFDITRLTGRSREYQKLRGGAIESLKFARRVVNHPINHPDNLHPMPVKLLVVKKQATVLDRLAGDLARINAAGELDEVPALVIDDESDQASVNTMRPPVRAPSKEESEERRERTRINEAIVRLLDTLPRGQYIGYTATPFANVFVDPADAENIFPRDFIVSLPRPVGYLGASDFHDLDGPPPGSDERPFLSNERAFVRPVYGDDTDATNLQRAIDSYLLAGAIKLHRAAVDPTFVPRHHTLMVHTSPRTADHREQLQAVKRQLTDGGYRTGTAAGRLRELFESDFAPISAVRAPGLPFPTYDEAEEHLGEVLSRLHRGANPVLLVNSTGEADQLAFDNEGVWKIIVGGAKLSRGFTVEGLTTSYFRRRSPTADTLMQMGRWCGFRRGYADLVRLFIGRREAQGRETVDVYEAFEGICRDEESFRQELERYAMPDNGDRPITPMDIPPLVATHLEWVRPTSRNKMFNAHIEFRNFGGRAVEHRRVAQSSAHRSSNEARVRELLEAGPLAMREFRNGAASVRAFAGVRSADQVRNLLGAYAFADRMPDLAAELEFIDGKLGDPSIHDWAVVLPQQSRATERTWRVAGHDVSVHRRGYWQDVKPLVNAFMGPIDKAIAESIVGVRPLDSASPDLEALRSDTRAALVVYPIHHGDSDKGGSIPTMGLTLVFPENAIPRRIGFAVRRPEAGDEPIVDAVGA